MDSDREESRLAAIGAAVETAVLGVLARRLKALDGDYSSARASEAADMAEINDLLQRGAETIGTEVDRIATDSAAESEEWAAPFFAYRGIGNPAVATDPALSGTVRRGVAGIKTSVAQACDSSALWLVGHDGRLHPFRDAFRSHVDAVVREIVAGRGSVPSEVTRAVLRVSNAGLRVRYQSGATRELYAALSQNIMDGFRDTMQALRDEQGRRFGADGVEVSAHGLCAADHLPFQGREFTNAEFRAVQDGLRRPIGKWNCRHMTSPVVVGVSRRAHSDADLEGMRRASERVTDAAGEPMSAYEFTQWQRARERLVRRDRMRARLLEDAGLDGSEWRRRADATYADYAARSKAAGIPTMRERTVVPKARP